MTTYISDFNERIRVQQELSDKKSYFSVLKLRNSLEMLTQRTDGFKQQIR